MSTLANEILAGARNGFGAGITRAGTVAENVFRIPVGQIEPDPENARQHFDADELQALADNMKRHGQLQNAVAWLRGDGRYQLVAGERRLRAAKLANIATLNVLVLPRGIAEETRQEMAFAENMARSELKPTEVARHWKSLMERWGISGRELAFRIGVAQSTVSKRLALLKTDADTQRAVDAGNVKATHVVEGMRRSRRAPKRRAARGVFELTASTLKLRRGYTLAQAVAELSAMAAAQVQADTTEGREAA
jgi:ParB family chromosome partitioning protein